MVVGTTFAGLKAALLSVLEKFHDGLSESRIVRSVNGDICLRE